MDFRRLLNIKKILESEKSILSSLNNGIVPTNLKLGLDIKLNHKGYNERSGLHFVLPLDDLKFDELPFIIKNRVIDKLKFEQARSIEILERDFDGFKKEITDLKDLFKEIEEFDNDCKNIS